MVCALCPQEAGEGWQVDICVFTSRFPCSEEHGQGLTVVPRVPLPSSVKWEGDSCCHTWPCEHQCVDVVFSTQKVPEMVSFNVQARP